MRTRYFAVVGLCAAAAVVQTSPALGQSPKDAKALGLLDQGKALLEKGKAAEACKALEESIAIEQAINTHYQLGRCYEAQNKFATAHASYLRAATMARTAGDNQRFEAAQAASDDLKAKIANVVVVVAPDVEIPGMTITRDGETVAREDWGKAVPVDAGEHTIKVEAPGYQPWSETVTAEQTGGASTVAVPKLEPLGAPAEPGEGEEPPEPDVDDSGWERRSSAVFGLGIAMTCLGGVSILGGIAGGAATAETDVGPGPFILMGALGLVFLGVGIPLTAVFGAKVPPDTAAADVPADGGEAAPAEGDGDDGATEPVDGDAPADDAPAVEETGYRLTPLLGPLGGGLRLDF